MQRFNILLDFAGSYTLPRTHIDWTHCSLQGPVFKGESQEKAKKPCPHLPSPWQDMVLK